MDLNTIKTIGTQTLGRGLLVTRKFAPEILTTVGVLGVVASTVLACKATLKLEETVETINEEVLVVKDHKVLIDHDGNEIQSDLDYKKDLARVYTRGTINIIRLYGPPVTLGLSSLVCILAAHGIQRKRNAALVAAYTVLEKGFSEYRKRVIEEVGEDKDREFRSGIRIEEVAEDGKKVTQVTFDPNAVSPYARFFDEGNVNWQREPGYNQLFLTAEQNYANDLLLARGHLFLNEVYARIGLDHTQAGSVVGWVVSKNGGDNFVDFGIFDPTNEQGRAFVNGQERSILLDFNVDGVIYDKI